MLNSWKTGNNCFPCKKFLHDVISCIFYRRTHIDELVSDSQFMDQSLKKEEKKRFCNQFYHCLQAHLFLLCIKRLHNINQNLKDFCIKRNKFIHVTLHFEQKEKFELIKSYYICRLNGFLAPLH